MKEILDLSSRFISHEELKEELSSVQDTVKVLDIHETSINSLYCSTQLKLDQLQELDISLTNITNLTPIGKLKNLKILYANHLKIQDLNFLQNCTKLEKLSLEYTEISNLQPIETLVNLKTLALTGDKWIEDLSFLSKLNNLEELYLEGTGIYRREQLSILKGKNIKKLSVNNELVSFAEVLMDSSKKESPILSQKVGNFGIFKNENKVKLSGELLDSFNEIMLGELEMLADMPDDEDKLLLIDLLFDKDRSISEVINYASQIDKPQFGKRFAILYCCMYPEKWNDPLMKEYQQSMISSYIQRSINSNDENYNNEERIKSLKDYANSFINKFLEVREIKKPRLSYIQEENKRKLLAEITFKTPDETTLSEDVEELKQDIKNIQELLKEGRPIEPFPKASIDEKGILLQPLQVEHLPTNVSNLKLKDDIWKRIFEMIKITPTGKVRSEEKMLSITNTILYKIDKNSRWRDLPSTPPYTTVRHYYYEWRNTGQLMEIVKLITTQRPIKTIN